jgi:hypothetical protein
MEYSPDVVEVPYDRAGAIRPVDEAMLEELFGRSPGGVASKWSR